ncbi:MAG: P-loop NTPase [Cyanobacteria bacterium P01_G01_bin.39]
MFFSTLDEIPAKAIHHQLKYDRHNIFGVKNIIAFSSGRGKAGKSTIAVNTAVMLAQAGLKIGLLDAEPNSDRSSEILGIKQPYIPTSKGLFQPVDNFGVKLVAIASLINGDPLEDWCDEWCDYWLNQEIKRILEEVQWGNLDYLIVNLPPRMGDIQIALAQALPLDGVVMVATDDKKAQPDIYKTVSMFEQLQVPVIGLLENKSNILSADISKRKYEIQDDEPSNPKLRVPFLGYVPLDPLVAQYKNPSLPIVLAEPSSMFTSALQIIVWAISSQISISALKS